jgi:hypothetical protein
MCNCAIFGNDCRFHRAHFFFRSLFGKCPVDSTRTHLTELSPLRFLVIDDADRIV